MPVFSGTNWTQTTFIFDFSADLTIGEGLVSHSALIDVNGDGFLDVVLTLSEGQIATRDPFLTPPAHIFINDGSGNFSDQTSDYFSVTQGLTEIVNKMIVADFNGDGRDDLFVADNGIDAEPYPGGQNHLWLSSGATGFIDASDRLPQQLAYSYSSSAADIDNDGDIDLFVNAVTNQLGTTPSAYFLINDGSAHFSISFDRIPARHGVSGDIGVYYSSGLLDANGDGFVDLLLTISGPFAPNVILLNDGAGHFFTRAPSLPPPGFPHAEGMDAVDVDIVDLNGDGRLDIATLMNAVGFPAPYLQILISNGDGTFRDESDRVDQVGGLVASGGLRAVSFADLNGDGFLDIFAEGQSLAAELNDGSGHFIKLPSSFFETNLTDPFKTLVADLDNDGLADLVGGFGLSATSVTFNTWIQNTRPTTLIGTADADALIGMALADALSGLAGDDVLFGGGGADDLSGGDDSDYLNGGAGVDTLDGGDGDDVLNDGAYGDTIDGGAGIDRAIVHFETAAGAAVVVGNGAITVAGISAGSLSDIERFELYGGTGNDDFTGGANADTLSGGLGDDDLNGSGGNDVLIGGGGGDDIDGGDGTDHAAINLSAESASIVFSANGVINVGGGAFGSVINVESFDFTGGAGADVISTGSGNDRLNGGANVDTLNGGAGDDIYVVTAGDLLTDSGGTDLVQSVVSWTLAADFENLTLLGNSNINATGNGLDNVLLGNTGNNIFQSGTGVDTLIGVAGNDTYHVEAGDTIVEAPAEGVDTIITTLTNIDLNASAYANCENVTYVGLGSCVATGNFEANILTGGAGNDSLIGVSVAGISDADTLVGGDGDDQYVFDDSATIVLEDADGGNDTIQTHGAFFSLASLFNVENLSLSNELSAAHGVGNAASNFIASGVADDLLEGADGDDHLVGNEGADTLFGGDGADQLEGNDGNDILRGGAGGDTFFGVAGLDIATYSTSSSGVTINLSTDNGGGGATAHGGEAEGDTFFSVENLIGSSLGDQLTGDAGANTLSGAGGHDTLAGGAGADQLIGGNGVDTASYASSGARVNVNLTTGAAALGDAAGDTFSAMENLLGSSFNDTLTGNSGVNTLTGGDGNDTLNGMGGIDTMIGGNGNDVFVVDVAGDVTTETSAVGGTDLVQSSLTRTLGANLENLTLTGAAAINGTGNALANVLTGNGAANTLSGAQGADTLNGGSGHDILAGGGSIDKFVFSAPIKALHSDTITDFTHNADKIQFENSVFLGLGTAGNLAAAKFFVGANAHDADDRVIYNAANGQLFYDDDGIGAHAKVLIVTLTAHPTLTAADIQVV